MNKTMSVDCIVCLYVLVILSFTDIWPTAWVYRLYIWTLYQRF